MKTIRYLSILSSVVFFACHQKKQLGFLGDMEVGKYEITQFKAYPNGEKDTLSWEAYGPYYQKSSNRYFFEIHDSNVYPTKWELKENSIRHTNEYAADPWSYSYVANYSEIETSLVEIEYSFLENNTNNGTDSAVGKLIVKRISL